jgi:hypothetical protein
VVQIASALSISAALVVDCMIIALVAAPVAYASGLLRLKPKRRSLS